MYIECEESVKLQDRVGENCKQFSVCVEKIVSGVNWLGRYHKWKVLRVLEFDLNPKAIGNHEKMLMT